MAAPESVRRAYAAKIQLAESVRSYVRSTLRAYCEERDYLFFDRIKSLESLSEKIEGGRIGKWSEIDDMYACTIVVPTAGHEPEVLESLKIFFNERVIRSRGTTKKAPEVFRFDTTRFYGTISAEAASERLPGIENLVFEVQIPTVFEYAWARVTHDLVYKSDSVDWRRLRLAAHLKAAVEQIEIIIESFEAVSSSVTKSTWPDIEMKSDIVNAFKGWISRSLIRAELAPESWNRFGDNVFSLLHSFTSTYKMPQAVNSLLQGLEQKLISQDPNQRPASGTLFQLVVGYFFDCQQSISKYVIAESEELSALYGIQGIEKPFGFDM